MRLVFIRGSAILTAPWSMEIAMGMLDGLLGQVAGNVDIQSLAARLGLTPEQVEQGVQALGAAHAAPGDTVTTAAAATGLPADKLQQMIEHIGGEGALGRFAGLLQAEGGAGGLLVKLGGLASGFLKE